MSVLCADSVCMSFGARAVLKSATLNAHAGRITVLLGRNGCGKTTLLRIAAGLLRADQGRITFLDKTFARPRLHRLAASGLFFLPERGLLVRNITVRRHFELVEQRFAVRRDIAAERLHLHDLMDRLPDTLSGGERRRAEVGLALARAPLCLLADEPFMGVEPRDAEILSSAFRSLADAGCALVITGHEAPTLLALADEIVWVVAGTTHSLGTPERARADWQFNREYLGVS